jgi:hypothetical protein
MYMLWKYKFTMTYSYAFWKLQQTLGTYLSSVFTSGTSSDDWVKLAKCWRR